MKKLFFILLLTTLLAACGDDAATEENSNNPPEEEKSSGEIQSENLEELEEVNAEVTSIEYYQWLDPAIDTETITVYAEIRNTSDVPIDVVGANLTYLDTDGGVIAVNESQVRPRFLNPDGTGYVIAEIEGSIDEYDSLNEVDIEVSPTAFPDAEIVDFSTRDENLKVDSWGQSGSDVAVTGYLENESSVTFTEDDTAAAIGIYDENGDFLAAEPMYSDQNFSLDANGETSFEIGGGSPLPSEVGENVDSVKVQAIGIEGMDNYWW